MIVLSHSKIKGSNPIHYWENRKIADWIRIIIFIFFLACFARGDESNFKIHVRKTASTKDEPDRTIPVPNAQVYLFYGILEASDKFPSTPGSWSASTNNDGIIESIIKPGIYTIVIKVDGKIKESITDPYKWPVISTVNGSDVCFFVFK